MAGQIKVDSINADSNLALKIANTAVAFIDSSGLRPTSGNVNLDATATSKLYLPSANTVAIQTAGVTGLSISSSQVVTLPGTLSVTGVTTLTGGLNAALPVLSGGTGVTTKTGTGAVVLGTSPTLVTPLLGTPTSGNLANCTGIPAPAALSTASGSAPSYSARAWVNFNGVNTAVIRSSGNVSSVTRNAAGDYTINFTTALPDADYAAAFMIGAGNDAAYGGTQIYAAATNRPLNAPATMTTSALRFVTAGKYAEFFFSDAYVVTVAIFR